MPKTKKRPDNKQTALWFVVIALAVVCASLIFSLGSANKDATNDVKPQQSVSLGAIGYTFTKDKATKRNDGPTRKLRAFLEQKAADEGCSAERPAYEHVVAYTKDESQILLKYGCGAADSPMFAVKKDGDWQSLSPTNHFDHLSIPECGYLEQNRISQEIAPVCVKGLEGGDPDYRLR